MIEPIWLERSVILQIHEEQIAEHGGLVGLRDVGALDSALSRAENKFHYENYLDIPSLAAAYGFGIAKNHPFADGNKRTAFVAVELFLVLNQYELTADDEACIVTFISLASGSLTEPELVNWIKLNSSVFV